MEPNLDQTDISDETVDSSKLNIGHEYECESCKPFVIKLYKESDQLKQKVKDLLQDRKEIFTKHEETIKQLHKTYLESSNKILKQETTKWTIHCKNLQCQIENLIDKSQLYQTSKQLVEDQLKNISTLIQMYEMEEDIDKKIDCKRQLYSMCGITTPIGDENGTTVNLKEYKDILGKVDTCLAECQQQLLDPHNELQLEKLKRWIVELITSSSLPNDIKKSILNNITPEITQLNYTLFIERVVELLLNATPNCYTNSDSNKLQDKIKYNENLEKHRLLYEQKIQHLEQICEINQKETIRASEEIQEHLRNEISRLKDSIITMEKGHTDDLKIMEDRCREYQQDTQSLLSENKVLAAQFKEEKDELESKMNSLREQLDIINENRKNLTEELSNYQNKYNNQHEINKSLHHALNTLRNESSVQYQMILDQCNLEKKIVLKDCDEQIELLKQQLENKENLQSINNQLNEEITALNSRINEMKFRANSTSNITPLDFDYDSTVIRILKSTLVAYQRAEPHKKHEVYSVLCGILGISKDDINNFHPSIHENYHEKSFISNLPIIGRFWSPNTPSDQTQTQTQSNNNSVDNTFTNLLFTYLEKESNILALPKMSNSDIDSLVGAISQLDQQPISTTLIHDTPITSNQTSLNSPTQLNLTSVIHDDQKHNNPT